MTTADQTPAGAPVPAGPAPDQRDRVAAHVRDTVRLRLGPRALEQAATGPIMLSGTEADAIADAALAALPELAQLDQLRERITALADSLDADGDSYLAWSLDHHQRGDQVTARVSRVRFEESRRHAARLRALLEET